MVGVKLGFLSILSIENDIYKGLVIGIWNVDEIVCGKNFGNFYVGYIKQLFAKILYYFKWILSYV